jgi:hypothetical protein
MTGSSQQPVSFGLSLPNRAVLFGGPISWKILLQASERAEKSGSFRSVLVSDNVLSKPRLKVVVALSTLAARTS